MERMVSPTNVLKRIEFGVKQKPYKTKASQDKSLTGQKPHRSNVP